jgi:hypothetical protein
MAIFPSVYPINNECRRQKEKMPNKKREVKNLKKGGFHPLVMFTEKYQPEIIEPKYIKYRKIFASLEGITWVRENTYDIISPPQPYTIKAQPIAGFYHLVAYACIGKVNMLSEETKEALRKTQKGRSRLRRMGKPEYRCLMWYLKPWDLTKENWAQFNKTPYVPMIPDAKIPNRVSIDRVLSFFAPVQQENSRVITTAPPEPPAVPPPPPPPTATQKVSTA